MGCALGGQPGPRQPHSLALLPSHPLLLPTGREANTINQLLADENMRKQNDYVEVGAKGVRDLPQRSAGRRS